MTVKNQIARIAAASTLGLFAMGCSGYEAPSVVYDGPVSTGHAVLKRGGDGTEILTYTPTKGTIRLKMRNDPKEPAYGDPRDSMWAFKLGKDNNGKVTENLELSREFFKDNAYIHLSTDGEPRVLRGTERTQWDGRVLERMGELEPVYREVRGEIADSLNTRVQQVTDFR